MHVLVSISDHGGVPEPICYCCKQHVVELADLHNLDSCSIAAQQLQPVKDQKHQMNQPACAIKLQVPHGVVECRKSC